MLFGELWKNDLINMAYIKILPENLVNKIAAGEVVENPASVVKELIENSLDSGADTIDISVTGGGLDLISISDNGSGIPRDQVPLAFERHATSKIEVEEDLNKIISYGFRGEALPAIASVSIVEMHTASPSESSGSRIVLEGGVVKSFEIASPRKGTSITVRKLFFNTPARRKFLKGEISETRKITAVVSKYAVSSYSTAIRLVSNGRELINYCSDSDLSDRLERLWGEKIGPKLIQIETQASPDLHISGYICRPEVSRGNRNQIYLVVNGRPIYDVSLIHALRSGYGNTLESGFFPLAAIFIKINPRLVDVNVHPAKTEVRFADDKFIYSQIRKIVESAIQLPALFVVPRAIVPGKADQSQRSSEIESTTIDKKLPLEFVKIRNHEHTYQIKRATDSVNSYDLTTPETNLELTGGEKYWQLYNTFVMGFRDGRIWMLDQHTAHERILYETALNDLYEHRGASQRLLFDLTIDLDPESMAVFESHIEMFLRLGFEIEPFGGRSLIIRGVPAYFRSSSIEEIFRNLLAGFMDGLSTGEEPNMALAASLACHAAIKSGEVLSQEQMQGLFSGLFECEDPYRCPHGRPTIVTISRDDLDKLFKR